MSPMSAYRCVLSASPVHQSFCMVLSLAWSVLQAVLYAAWQLDHQVLQADDCGRSVSFRAVLGFSYLLRQTSLNIFWSTGQQLQPLFPVVWSSSASAVPQALQNESKADQSDEQTGFSVNRL